MLGDYNYWRHSCQVIGLDGCWVRTGGVGWGGVDALRKNSVSLINTSACVLSPKQKLCEEEGCISYYWLTFPFILPDPWTVCGAADNAVFRDLLLYWQPHQPVSSHSSSSSNTTPCHFLTEHTSGPVELVFGLAEHSQHEKWSPSVFQGVARKCAQPL